MAIAPSVLRGRLVTTTFVYDDQAHPERPSGSVSSPAWTEDDRSLLLGLEMYEATLCSGGCGQPRETAWHADAEGEYDGHRFVCHACTARAGQQVVYTALVATPASERVATFVPFDLLTTTTEPTPEGAE
jgi:hypothetical protein